MIRRTRKSLSPCLRSIAGFDRLEERCMLNATSLAPSAQREMVADFEASQRHIHAIEVHSAFKEMKALAHFRSDYTLSIARTLRPGFGHANQPRLNARDISFVSRAAASGPVGGFSPAQVVTGYGVNQLSNQGQGMTIAIVDAYDDPNIVNDLAVFSNQYGLPQMDGTNGDPTFSKVFAQGIPQPNSGWAVEISLDVEWAHAIAPRANIVLVEAHDAYHHLDLADKVAARLPGVVVVSNSWGGPEYSSETTDDALFTTPPGHAPVIFTVSTGDNGAPGGYPAYSPNVVAVGGTSLYLNSNNTYQAESGWLGSGGGVSYYENVPGYQSANGVSSFNYGSSGPGSYRSIPDISLIADPHTGVSIYDSFRAPGWAVVGGTSLASPVAAALIALGDQVRGQKGLAPLDTNGFLTKIYGAYNSGSYHNVFHDVTSGYNGYFAGLGYDLATGVGSPIASGLVGLMSSP